MKLRRRWYHINRQIGDYVVISKVENVAPFFVRKVGEELPISTHWSVTDAVRQILYGRCGFAPPNPCNPGDNNGNTRQVHDRADDNHS